MAPRRGALKFASNCGQAYRSANDRIRRLYNSASSTSSWCAAARSPMSITGRHSNWSLA
jgi:hypothetical protein